MLCIVKANETKNKRTKKDLKRTKKDLKRIKKDLEKKRKREREMLKQSSKYTKTKVLKFSKPSTNTRYYTPNNFGLTVIRKNGMKD